MINRAETPTLSLQRTQQLAVFVTLTSRFGVLFRTAAARALGVGTALSHFVGLSAMRR